MCWVSADGSKCLYLPQLHMHKVCMWINWETLSWTCPISWQGCQVGGGSMPLKCGVSVGQVCAVSTQLDQPLSWGPVEKVNGAGIQADMSGRQRGCAQVSHKRACTWEPGECVVCCTSDLLTASPRGSGCLCLLCLAGGSALSVIICVDVFCVYVSGICNQHHYWLNL